jgi:polyhydroxyalkanoate synthesis regulator protein
MAMFERAMQMFTPFAANGAAEPQAENAPADADADADADDEDDMSALKDQLKALQEQVDKLSRT